MDYCIVTTTCGTRQEAEDLTAGIIEKRLAACVQLSEIVSCYVWKGEVCRDPEVKLLMKTNEACLKPLEGFIKANHSYDVPEIICVEIQSGSPEYLAWIDEVVR